MKQMFYTSEELIVGHSDEIYGVTPINWEDSSWKHLSLVSDEEVISLSHAKVYVFSDSVLCLGKVNLEPNIKYCLGRKIELVQEFITMQNFDTIDGEPMEFEWNIFPGLTTLQLCNKVHEFMPMSDPSELQDGSSSCRCSTTSHGDLKTMYRNANSTPTSFLFLREDFHQEDGHSSDMDQKRSAILLLIAIHKENGTESQK